MPKKANDSNRKHRSLAFKIPPLVLMSLLSPGITPALADVSDKTSTITQGDPRYSHVEKKEMVMGMTLYEMFQINEDDANPVYSTQIPPRILTQVKENKHYSPVLIEYAAIEKHHGGHIDFFLRKTVYKSQGYSTGDRSTTPVSFQEVNVGSMIYGMLTNPENRDVVDPSEVFNSMSS